MSRIGLIRALDRQTNTRSGVPPKGISAEDWVRLQTLSYQATAVAECAGEACYNGENTSEVRAAGDLKDRPLIVLTSGKLFAADDSAEQAGVAAFNDLWVHQLQPQLARLSARGRQVIVPDGNFGIHYEAPEALVQAVREVAGEILTARH